MFITGSLRIYGIVIVTALLCMRPAAWAKSELPVTPQFFEQAIRPLTKQYCFECHSTAKHKGDIDLESFTSVDLVKRHPDILQRMVDELRDEQMPPDDASKQATSAQLNQLQDWARAVLDAIALEHAGDPGPVMLRRLSNAEYTYTVRDLTGIESLDPVKEFPEDGAAGEGFTNAGQALVMSPSLVTKYLDAAKGIASHAVLLPGGMRFSSKSSRLDWTNEIVAEIRDFYRRFAELPADKNDFEGIKSQNISIAGPHENGRLPLDRYFTATIEARESLRTGAKTPAEVAQEYQLSPKYFGSLWALLTSGDSSPLLDGFRARWRIARPGDVPALVAEIAQWQNLMWKFGKVGSLDNDGNPRLWMESTAPLAEQQELRLPLKAPATGNDIVVYLAAGNAGDTVAGNLVEWQEARLIRPGRPTVLLRDAQDHVRELMAKRQRIFALTAEYLAAATEVSEAQGDVDVPALARRHRLEPDTLQVWLNYLGIDARSQPGLELFSEKLTHITGWDFIQGWGSADAPGLVANSTDDQRVLIPGVILPRAVMVHPADAESAAVGWRSPVKAVVRIEAMVTHVSSGHGVNWSLELRRGRLRTRLATGRACLVAETTEFDVPGVTVGPVENVAVEPGDLISLLVGARDGDSSNDHTIVKLNLTTMGEKPEEWSLSGDVSSNVLAGNPHADRAGREGVWSFYREPAMGTEWLEAIPTGSLLSRWAAAGAAAEKRHLAAAIQRLLTSERSTALSSVDTALQHYLTSLGGPFFAGIPPKARAPSEGRPVAAASAARWGLDRGRFGQNPRGSAAAAASLVVKAPSVIELHLPADLFAGGELVTTARILQPMGGAVGTVQVHLLDAKPNGLDALEPGWCILANKDSAAWKRVMLSSEEFNRIFPAALCYSKLTPTDEVITMEIFHRDDRAFADLMLNDDQKAQLDRLWDQLHYVSQDVFALKDVCEERQKGDIDLKKVQIPRWPQRDWAEKSAKASLHLDYARILSAVNTQAAAFQSRLIDSQPRHLEAVLDFADQAYRRPLSDAEKAGLRRTYDRLRKLDLPHDAAICLLMARVLTSPAFLYRSETPGPGVEPLPVSVTELSTRLSYFLWSSAPDTELRAVAARGKLRDPGELLVQTRRMLGDPRVRHLATEFGCEWLRIHDFDRLGDKSARVFPGFSELREAMYEESILFLTDLFQNNRPVLNLIDCDYTFLNEALAQHYGIPGIKGAELRRVDGIRNYSRGGILAQATVLSKQSGASRTSPILRGSWIVEVLLGTKLPKPPANVPQLPEDESLANLTVRQLTERHVSDPRCAGCHARFNAFGYALEGFDGVGRFREKDLGNRPIETHAKLGDGGELAGFKALRDYLLTQRREEFVRQFCRKLLGYALGRSVQISDDVLLDKMQAQLAANGYRVETAIEAIVLSQQFRDIRGRDFAAGGAEAISNSTKDRL